MGKEELKNANVTSIEVYIYFYNTKSSNLSDQPCPKCFRDFFEIMKAFKRPLGKGCFRICGSSVCQNSCKNIQILKGEHLLCGK